MTVRWTERAASDLLAIGDHIAADNLAAARSWVEKLRQRAVKASKMPRSGRGVPEIVRDDVREVFQRTYRIVYRVVDDGIVVLPVFAASWGSSIPTKGKQPARRDGAATILPRFRLGIDRISRGFAAKILLVARRSATVRRDAVRSRRRRRHEPSSDGLPQDEGIRSRRSTDNAASVLEVVHAYAVSADGTAMGVLIQLRWAWPRRKKQADCQYRLLEAKETLHWVNAINDAALALTAVESRAWFQIDREGDPYWTLKALRDSGAWFTVRSTYAHRVAMPPV